jgi:hypothetical protein
MWIIFEGLDKAGKTTLEWDLLKKTNYKHIVIDRGPASYLVFDRIFERETQKGIKEFTRQSELIVNNDDFIVVYCHAKENKIRERLIEYKEVCDYDYKRAQKLLDNIINTLYRFSSMNVLKLIDINTTNMSVDECTDKIIERINIIGKVNEYQKYE